MPRHHVDPCPPPSCLFPQECMPLAPTTKPQQEHATTAHIPCASRERLVECHSHQRPETRCYSVPRVMTVREFTYFSTNSARPNLLLKYNSLSGVKSVRLPRESLHSTRRSRHQNRSTASSECGNLVSSPPADSNHCHMR